MYHYEAVEVTRMVISIMGGAKDLSILLFLSLFVSAEYSCQVSTQIAHSYQTSCRDYWKEGIAWISSG